MTDIHQLKAHFVERLLPIYEKEEIQSFFNWLAQDILGLSTLDLLLNSKVELSQNQLEDFRSATQRLSQEEPIQYILGYTEFFGIKLNVNSNVLIPRPETEELVQWILEDYCSIKLQVNVMDLGTGSGCIAIALAKHLHQAKIKALDVSSEALLLATKNWSSSIDVANSEEKIGAIEFIEADILELKHLPEVDVLVSNPPYVKYDEQPQMMDNVLKNEPHLALFVDDTDPLIFYKKIAQLAVQATKTPVVYLEINQHLAEETIQVFRDFGFKSIELRKDFRGNNRMLKAY